MSPRSVSLGGAVATRAAILGGAWWAVAEGAGTGWGFAVVVVGLAVVASLTLQGAAGPVPRLRSIPGFAVWFLRRSVSGGVQVAFMAVRPRLDIAPAVIAIPLRLPPGWPTVMLADVVSLLPGTLAVSTQGRVLELHVLDERVFLVEDVRELEERVAQLFGVGLEDRPPS